MTSARFWTVVLLLVLTGGLLLSRGNTDAVPPSQPLSTFPATLDGRTATDIPLSQETLDVLGKGVFLSRVYTAPDSQTPTPPPVSLFIGYFPTQRSGQSIHSPQNCLPGAGWTFDSSGTIDVDTATTRPMQVGEYLISNGPAKAEVLYWYQSHGRAIANDYKAKLFMLTDAIRLNRTDAALVRIVTPVQPDEPRAAARARALAFAQSLAPLLPTYIPN